MRLCLNSVFIIISTDVLEHFSCLIPASGPNTEYLLTLSLNFNDDDDDNDIIQMIFNSKCYLKIKFRIKDKHPLE